MTLERWKPKAHYKAIASWYLAQNLEAPDIASFPEIGFIVDNRVAGWIARTDNCTAVIERAVYNPSTLPSTHEAALTTLVGVLLDTVTMLGYTRIIVASDDVLLSKVAEKYTFSLTKQVCYILDETYESDPSDWVDD